MPINPDLMANLMKEYGAKKGRSVYFAMENKGNPSTKPAAIRKAREKRRVRATVRKGK